MEGPADLVDLVDLVKGCEMADTTKTTEQTTNAKAILLRMTPSLFAEIEKARGLIPRERWIRHTLEESLEGRQ